MLWPLLGTIDTLSKPTQHRSSQQPYHAAIVHPALEMRRWGAEWSGVSTQASRTWCSVLLKAVLHWTRETGSLVVNLLRFFGIRHSTSFKCCLLQGMAQVAGASRPRAAPGQPFVFKLVLLGSGSVGKSSLALRYVKNDFRSTLPTVGCK